MLEKLLLKRRVFQVETWKIVIALLFLVLAFNGFGALVEWGVRKANNAPMAAQWAKEFARIPLNAKRLITETVSDHKPTHAKRQRFDGEGGFKRFKDSDDEALLLSRYDGDSNQAVVELLDLQSGTVLHRYTPDNAAILKRAVRYKDFDLFPVNRNPEFSTVVHPVLTDEGGLIFHGMNAPLAKIDVCSNIVWVNDQVAFRHALEVDTDGNYWTASYLTPSQTKRKTAEWYNDTIVKISPDGDVLFERSIAEILAANNLDYMLYSGQRYSEDPLHVNDVQPALKDGEYWRKNDLFLSLRHASAVLIYRPSTNEVVWYQAGPWLMQHDVDIISDHEIAVFSNRAAIMQSGFAMAVDVNQVVIHDFRTGKSETPFSAAFEQNEIRTPTQGRSELLPDGQLFVEETDYGRILKVSDSGDVIWQYINRASDGNVYVVNWSRYLSLEAAHAAVRQAENCAK